LHITGRDVEENDHALSFDPATGSWTMLGGSVEQHTMSDTRALIARYVRDYPAASRRTSPPRLAWAGIWSSKRADAWSTTANSLSSPAARTTQPPVTAAPGALSCHRRHHCHRCHRVALSSKNTAQSR
jgi:hypothetical protein